MWNPFERPRFGKAKQAETPVSPEHPKTKLENLQLRLQDLREQREAFGVHPGDAPLEQRLIDEIRSLGGNAE